MTERRLGRGWNAERRRWWWEEGRMRAARARFTRSPSTVPMRTSEFVMAERRALRRFEGEDAAAWGEEERWWGLPLWKPLWRLHRNDPGCVVGEHMHVLRPGAAPPEDPPPPGTGRRDGIWSDTEKDRPGEVDRWWWWLWWWEREKRTEEVGEEGEGTRLTRVGEAERWKNEAGERAEKLEEDDEANAVVAAAAEEEKRPEGEIDRWNALEIGSTGPLDLLDELAIAKPPMEKG